MGIRDMVRTAGSLAILARLRPGGPTPGRLGGGAGPRRALATRASRGGPRDGSWSPWPGTGAPAAAMDAWSRAGGARSPRPANHPGAGRAQRLTPAATPRAALTPPRGRGPRQRPAAAPRGAALDLVRHDQRVAGWRRGAWAPQGERPPPDVGRGRGAAGRPVAPRRGHSGGRARRPWGARARPPASHGAATAASAASRARRGWSSATTTARAARPG